MKRSSSRWIHFGLFAAWLGGSFLSLVKADTATANHDLAALISVSDQLDQVLLHKDLEVATSIALPYATALYDDGRLHHNFLKNIKNESEKKAKAEKDPKKNWQPQPLRVLHREFKVTGSVAVATEYLGAIAPAPPSERVKPRRRSVTWIQQSNGAWQLASLHESGYSRWEASIAAFEEKDKIATPPIDGIVFVGSSSIRGWKTLKDDFLAIPVIGRGFGGSQLIDSTMYAHRIVLPYRPAAVAIYAGDNDIGYGKSPEQVFHDFQKLSATLHASDPKLQIGFIAIKPSLARWTLWPDMKRANQMVADYANGDERISYLDIATPMLGKDGTPRKELFVKDGLHMTRAGYETWTSVVLPWAQAINAPESSNCSN